MEKKGDLMSKFKTREEFFDFAKLLVVIPFQELAKLITKYELKIPLYVHRFLLKEAIRPEVFQEALYQTYTDEQKFRLRGYNNYSIFLLEKLINDYNLAFSVARYKEMMLNLIFVNRESLLVKDNFFQELETLKKSYTVDLEVLKYHEFYPMIEKVFYQQTGYLDGIAINQWHEEMLVSYTLGDLKGLGKKYEINIPRRINKNKLIEILEAKFKLSAKEVEELQAMAVLDIEIYAKEKGFKISIDLKKIDMIEYLKFALGMLHIHPRKDFFDYDIPLFSDSEVVVQDIVEEKIEEQYVPEEIHDEVEEVLQDVIKEEVKPEPIVEEVVPIVEEKKEEAPKPVVVEEVKPEVSEEFADIEIPEELKEEPVLADQSLLTPEEKQLLDEKINQIIKRYYRRRLRRRIFWTIIILLVLGAAGYFGYTYLWPIIGPTIKSWLNI